MFRRENKAKISIFGILVFGAIAAAFFVLQEGEQKIKLTGNALQPKKFTRTIRNTDFKSLSVEEKFNKHLHNPMQIKFFEDNLFVADFGDMKVKRFSKDGELLATIGKGRGRGPGELLHIVDFHVGKDQKIWIMDGAQLTANSFDMDGNYIDSFTLKFNPLRITVSDGNLLTLGIGDPYLFKKLDQEGNVKAEFGQLIEDQMQNPLSLDGWITNIPNNGFVYVPMYASLIYFYGPKDSLFKMSRRPDGLMFANSINKSTEDRAYFMAPSVSRKGAYISKDNSFLYVNEYFEEESSIEQRNNTEESEVQADAIIDKYNLNTSKYMYSFVPPFAFKIFQITGDTLFINRAGKIKAYKF